MAFAELFEHKLCLERLVIGLEEPILIKGIGQMMAKVDSGNDGYNVIHGEDCYQQGNILIFTTYDFDGNKRQVSKKIVDSIHVHIGSGVVEERPVVRLNIKFANEDYKEVPFSVANRGENKMKVLISKSFVKDELNALIDVGAVGISEDGIEYEPVNEGWKDNSVRQNLGNIIGGTAGLAKNLTWDLGKKIAGVVADTKKLGWETDKKDRDVGKSGKTSQGDSEKKKEKNEKYVDNENEVISEIHNNFKKYLKKKSTNWRGQKTRDKIYYDIFDKNAHSPIKLIDSDGEVYKNLEVQTTRPKVDVVENDDDDNETLNDSVNFNHVYNLILEGVEWEGATKSMLQKRDPEALKHYENITKLSKTNKPDEVVQTNDAEQTSEFKVAEATPEQQVEFADGIEQFFKELNALIEKTETIKTDGDDWFSEYEKSSDKVEYAIEEIGHASRHLEAARQRGKYGFDGIQFVLEKKEKFFDIIKDAVSVSSEVQRNNIIRKLKNLQKTAKKAYDGVFASLKEKQKDDAKKEAEQKQIESDYASKCKAYIGLIIANFKERNIPINVILEAFTEKGKKEEEAKRIATLKNIEKKLQETNEQIQTSEGFEKFVKNGIDASQKNIIYVLRNISNTSVLEKFGRAITKHLMALSNGFENKFGKPLAKVQTDELPPIPEQEEPGTNPNPESEEMELPKVPTDDEQTETEISDDESVDEEIGDEETSEVGSEEEAMSDDGEISDEETSEGDNDESIDEESGDEETTEVESEKEAENNDSEEVAEESDANSEEETSESDNDASQNTPDGLPPIPDNVVNGELPRDKKNDEQENDSDENKFAYWVEFVPQETGFRAAPFFLKYGISDELTQIAAQIKGGNTPDNLCQYLTEKIAKQVDSYNSDLIPSKRLRFLAIKATGKKSKKGIKWTVEKKNFGVLDEQKIK